MTIHWLTLPALLIALTVAPAAAQMVCGKRADMVRQLSGEFGETRRGMGLAGVTEIFEVWASAETGTWTILKTYPSGRACALAAGDNWQDDPRQLRDPI